MEQINLFIIIGAAISCILIASLSYDFGRENPKEIPPGKSMAIYTIDGDSTLYVRELTYYDDSFDIKITEYIQHGYIVDDIIEGDSIKKHFYFLKE